VFHPPEANLYPPLDRSKEGQEIPVPWPINGTGPENQDLQSISDPEYRLFTLTLAPPIVGHWVTGIGFSRESVTFTGADRREARQVNESLKVRISFNASPDQILCSHYICVIEGPMIDCLGYTGQMVHLAHSLNSHSKGGQIGAIALKNLNGKPPDPPPRTPLSDETTYLVSLSQKGLHQMTANEPRCPCDQHLAGCHDRGFTAENTSKSAMIVMICQTKGNRKKS
jgi:hypothetical protein